MKQKFTATGKLGYLGPDDPPAEYYYFETDDGKRIYIGFDAAKFGGTIHTGIPALRMKTSDPYRIGARITIEVDDES